jgi:hypothetical protein
MRLPINYYIATWAERKAARLAYITRQGGKCLACKAPLTGEPNVSKLRDNLDPAIRTNYLCDINRSNFPKGFFNHPIHLHHSHKTGKTIGAVHAYCNAWLWQYLGE